MKRLEKGKVVSKRLLFRGGRVVDPVSGLDDVRDVLVEGTRIAGVGDVTPEGAAVFDCEGLILSPGLVDMHTHLR